MKTSRFIIISKMNYGSISLRSVTHTECCLQFEKSCKGKGFHQQILFTLSRAFFFDLTENTALKVSSCEVTYSNSKIEQATLTWAILCARRELLQIIKYAINSHLLEPAALWLWHTDKPWYVTMYDVRTKQIFTDSLMLSCLFVMVERTMMA